MTKHRTEYRRTRQKNPLKKDRQSIPQAPSPQKLQPLRPGGVSENADIRSFNTDKCCVNEGANSVGAIADLTSNVISPNSNELRSMDFFAAEDLQNATLQMPLAKKDDACSSITPAAA